MKCKINTLWFYCALCAGLFLGSVSLQSNLTVTTKNPGSYCILPTNSLAYKPLCVILTLLHLHFCTDFVLNYAKLS